MISNNTPVSGNMTGEEEEKKVGSINHGCGEL